MEIAIAGGDARTIRTCETAVDSQCFPGGTSVLVFLFMSAHPCQEVAQEGLKVCPWQWGLVELPVPARQGINILHHVEAHSERWNNKGSARTKRTRLQIWQGSIIQHSEELSIKLHRPTQTRCIFSQNMEEKTVPFQIKGEKVGLIDSIDVLHDNDKRNTGDFKIDGH